MWWDGGIFVCSCCYCCFLGCGGVREFLFVVVVIVVSWGVVGWGNFKAFCTKAMNMSKT